MISIAFSTAKEKLISEIEQLREQMIILGNRHGFLHPEVQSCSRQLDQLLVQFYDQSRALMAEPPLRND